MSAFISTSQVWRRDGECFSILTPANDSLLLTSIALFLSLPLLQSKYNSSKAPVEARSPNSSSQPRTLRHQARFETARPSSPTCSSPLMPMHSLRLFTNTNRSTLDRYSLLLLCRPQEGDRRTDCLHLRRAIIPPLFKLVLLLLLLVVYHGRAPSSRTSTPRHSHPPQPRSPSRRQLPQQLLALLLEE